jgi:hypothetical protein
MYGAKGKKDFIYFIIYYYYLGKNGPNSPHYEGEKNILKLPYLASNNSLNYRKVFYFPL